MSAIFRVLLFLATAGGIAAYYYGLLDVREWSPAPSTLHEASVDVSGPPTKAEIDEELDYEVARRTGSAAGWRSYLASHPVGEHAEFAKAELKKLPADDAVALPSNPVGQGAQPDSPPAPADATAPVDGVRSSQAEAALRFAGEPTGGPAPAGGPPAQPATVATAPAAVEAAPQPNVAAFTQDDCRRDEERLEGLRVAPSAEKVARLESELRCETLRPQLQRLADSLGASTSPPLSASPAERSAAGPEDAAACATDQSALDRVRRQPSPDAVERLWRDLRCERLRPQVRLVLESLDLTADPSGKCRDEAEKLKQIRSNPNRLAAENFARDVKCEALRPQVARLLDSLGQ